MFWASLSPGLLLSTAEDSFQGVLPVISWNGGYASEAVALAKTHALHGGAGCVLGFSAAQAGLPSVGPSSAQN